MKSSLANFSYIKTNQTYKYFLMIITLADIVMDEWMEWRQKSGQE